MLFSLFLSLNFVVGMQSSEDGMGNSPYACPIMSINSRKLASGGYLSISVSSLDLLWRVLGARISLLTEGASLEELVQKAGSGKEYRVSATANHCDHSF